MGASKSYRKGPGWESRNTPGATTKPSTGPVVNAEGTHMSGSDDYGRKGMSNSVQKKSNSGKIPSGNKGYGPHGMS